MTWTAVMQSSGDSVLCLDLLGDVRSTAAPSLAAMLVQSIEVGLPDELVIGLHAVAAVDDATVTALMAGYIAAVEHGTSYRVVGAHGPVRDVLLRTGTLDLLTDSDDLGALLLAVLLRG